MFLHLSYSIIIYSIWGGRDLNKIQTPAPRPMRPWQSWHSSWWGPRGLCGEEIASMGVPQYSWMVYIGKGKNGESLVVVCSCLFSLFLPFFPPMSSQQVQKQYHELKWSEYGPQKGFLTWLLPKLRSVWVLLSTASQHWSTSSHFGGR